MITISGSITGNNAHRFTFGNQSQYIIANRFVAWGYTGFQAGTPVANSGVVYMGFTQNELPIQIPTGGYVSWELPLSQSENFNNLWVKSTIGNGVFLIGY